MMTDDETRSRERRWIVLSTDGRFSTLGRATDPSEQMIASAEAELRRHGLSGWLAVMQGNPYAGDAPRLMEVRPLAGPVTPFNEAAEACVRQIMSAREPS